MDQVYSSGSDLDLDIDLESGGTSEEDVSRSDVLRGEIPENLLSRIRSGFTSSESLCESTNGGDCSCSYDKCIMSNEISSKNKEDLGKFREEIITFVHETMHEEKPKKKYYAKPPRPPGGPLLGASDMKLLKEISELNSKRRRMRRSQTVKKTKEKTSSPHTNLFACLVTIVFFLVIIFQGLLGSRV